MRYPLVKGGRSRFGGTSGVLLYGFIAWRNCSKSSMDALRTCGTTNKTAAAHSHMAIETISARRWVTMMWYRKANLTAMDRSKLIKARWRMITERRKKLEHELGTCFSECKTNAHLQSVDLSVRRLGLTGWLAIHQQWTNSPRLRLTQFEDCEICGTPGKLGSCRKRLRRPKSHEKLSW